MKERTRMRHTVSLRGSIFGMVTEILFACGLIGLGLLVSWLFFLGH